MTSERTIRNERHLAAVDFGFERSSRTAANSSSLSEVAAAAAAAAVRSRERSQSRPTGDRRTTGRRCLQVQTDRPTDLRTVGETVRHTERTTGEPSERARLVTLFTGATLFCCVLLVCAMHLHSLASSGEQTGSSSQRVRSFEFKFKPLV